VAVTAPAVAYPSPGSRLLVPAAGRRAAATGASIFMVCRPVAVAAHHAEWALVRGVGPRVLRGPRTRDAFDADDAVLLDAIAAVVGPVDAVAVLRRRQEGRAARLWLALRAGEPVGFVKAVDGEGAARLDRERLALDVLATQSGPVTVPRVVAHGTTPPWTWLVSTPMPARPHRPAVHRVPLDAIAEWLHHALGAALGPRPPELPSHWLPMHGDFAPWNLRRYAGGPLVLLDFEEAAYGPPRADVTYWQATRAALRGGVPRAVLDREARDFWVSVVAARLACGDDVEANERRLRALRAGP
jgi:hypothetical protein